MPGPPPKDPGARRRRNAPARGEWVDLDPLPAPILDPLPDLEGEAWSPNTFAMWEAWRADPVTAFWTPADLAYAMDTIMLHQAMTPSNANEIRLRMDGLGLTPKGKRDLRYRVPEQVAEIVELKGKPRGGKMPQARRLRAV